MSHTDAPSSARDRLARRLAEHAEVLFPGDASAPLVEGLIRLAEQYRPRLEWVRPSMDQGTAYLIAYGDSFRRDGERPLATLADVVRQHLTGAVSDVHLLPIFPWTSDDGFAVVDYRTIDPALGDWDDVAALSAEHQVMLDFVANHTSASSPWFTGWLAGEERYRDYYVTPGDMDLTRVVRPRTSPLLTPFTRPDGQEVAVWTTFGPDQVDVNAANVPTLLDLTDVLLGYLAAGATTIRLDAIGFLWKESGTTCLHHPATHAIIKMWRVLVDEIAPGARLLTETNVPHADNVTYLGSGSDEAHMVYQFALPPLVLHTFLAGSSERLSRWAASLEDLGGVATWFNFLASHDGIGMRPVQGILEPQEAQALADRALERGGRANYATGPDGEQAVYELNIAYLDALVSPREAEDTPLVVRRALAAHAILVSMVGVPAIYYHSMFGSGSDIAGMRESGINRRINRKRLDADALAQEVETDPRRRGILEGIRHLLQVRSEHPAFSPYAAQEVLDLGEEVFALRRGSGGEAMTVVVNVSGDEVALPALSGRDLLTGETHASLVLAPDQVVWLQ